MNLLAIESATDAVGVALARDGAGTTVVLHEGGRAHAELLVPSIEQVCRDARPSGADLDVVAVDAGPGLFTGLRVGVATAKALGQALSIGVVPVSSLDVLAAGAFERIAGEQVAASGRGGRRSARRRSSSPSTTSTGPSASRQRRSRRRASCSTRRRCATTRRARSRPRYSPNGSRALSRRGRVLAVGDGAPRYRDLLVAEPDVDLELAGELRVPPPAMLARLAADRLANGARPEPPDAVRPDYRREADARINWEERSPRPWLEGLDAADRRPA